MELLFRVGGSFTIGVVTCLYAFSSSAGLLTPCLGDHELDFGDDVNVYILVIAGRFLDWWYYMSILFFHSRISGDCLVTTNYRSRLWR